MAAAEVVGGAFLSSFLNVVFDRLSKPEVVNWVRGRKLDQELLQRLETILYAVQAVLNDAEQKQITDPAVKKWLVNLEDAVYKADDLLDEVSTKAATQKQPGTFLSRFLNLQDREMVHKMEDIIDILESFVKQKDTLGLKSITTDNMSWRVPSTPQDKMSDVYGRDKDREAIVKLLLDDTNDGEVSVIPIVGMGGAGKTTLAQLVYHDDKVKQNFSFQAWVCVSEEFDVIKVTKTLIEAITLYPCEINDLNLLQYVLKEKLSRQKFLVVLDDIWNENFDDWNRLLKPLRHGVKGSKLLITTRNGGFASMVQTVPSLKLSLLSDEDCWLLFLKHALLSSKCIENPTLEIIGRGIVNKCEGLPLAVQTLGGLLRGNYDVRYWDRILKSEIWEFSEYEGRIIPALRISYHYLPSYLKRCFVYCSLYPKDYRFDKDELILLWMAEGLLQPEGRKTLEEIGCVYFNELVERSFFQPWRKNSMWKHENDHYFVMHDLMHDLATFYAGEFYFRVEQLGNATEIGIKTRHLSHNAIGNYPPSKLLAACERVKHTRTFIGVNLDSQIPFNMEAPYVLLAQLKCIRVLSFKSFPLAQLPDSIGELIHMRYLDLSATPIVTLPESLNHLYNLQTLKLMDCKRLKILPSNMQNLVNLRHLDIRGTNIVEMPKGMSKLKDLQFLSDYIVGKDEENGIRELGALASLHGSLNIYKLENVVNSFEALEARIVEKEHINVLELRWASDGDIVNSQIERDILDKLRPYIDLKELSIQGYRGTMFPYWLGHSSYHNMTKLKLGECCNCFILPSLGELPSLNYLEISEFHQLEIIGAEFYSNDESYWETPFPSLETLKLHGMSRWQVWRSFEFDAFPKLKELSLEYCPMLRGDLPNHLPALETLDIFKCPQLAFSNPRALPLLK